MCGMERRVGEGGAHELDPVFDPGPSCDRARVTTDTPLAQSVVQCGSQHGKCAQLSQHDVQSMRYARLPVNCGLTPTAFRAVYRLAYPSMFQPVTVAA